MHGQALGQHSPHKQEYIYIFFYSFIFLKQIYINNKSFLFFGSFFSFLLFFLLVWCRSEKTGGGIPATAIGAKKVFSCLRSPTAINPHSVNVPALKKIKKNLKKYLFFFEKVLTIGTSDDIMSITTEYQNGSGATSGEGDHRQGIRVTRACIKECAMKAENDN